MDLTDRQAFLKSIYELYPAIKVTAIIEHNGALVNPKGINVEVFLKQFMKRKNIAQIKIPQTRFQKDNSIEIFESDILIPCAKENVIDQRIARKIKTKLILSSDINAVSHVATEFTTLEDNETVVIKNGKYEVFAL